MGKESPQPTTTPMVMRICELCSWHVSLGACENLTRRTPLDRFIACFNNEGDSNQLYQNDRGLGFSDATSAAGVGDADADGYSVMFFDFDNDGDLDLHVANTGTDDRLYENDGAAVFTDVAEAQGVANAANSRGSCYSDVDGDGDLDLYVSYFNDANALYINNNPITTTLLVRPLSASGSHTMYGAAVNLYIPSTRALVASRVMDGGSGYASQSGYLAHFAALATNTCYDVAIYATDNSVVWYECWSTDTDQSVSTLVMASSPAPTVSPAPSFVPTASPSSLPTLLVRPSAGPTPLPSALPMPSPTPSPFSMSGQCANSGMSRGACFGDCDNDGDDDLFVATHELYGANELYLNDGNGNFTEAAMGANVDSNTSSLSCSWADYDEVR